MKNIITCLLLVLFSSCSVTYVELYKTKSNLVNIDNKEYIFDNDTVRIRYSFWKERGIMYFNIYNKLNVPIYIDWKKSSFITNSNKINYWNDIIETKSRSSLSFDREYIYTGALFNPYSNLYNISGTQVQVTSSKTVRPERITFLPPNSSIEKSPVLLTTSGSLNKGDFTPKKDYRNDDFEKKTTIYKKEYNINNTPINFRNYITISTNENFTTEATIDNQFYIGEVYIMEKLHFQSAVQDINGKYETTYYFKNGVDFFRYVKNQE
jgi:hypothetical protein